VVLLQEAQVELLVLRQPLDDAGVTEEAQHVLGLVAQLGELADHLLALSEHVVRHRLGVVQLLEHRDRKVHHAGLLQDLQLGPCQVIVVVDLQVRGRPRRMRPSAAASMGISHAVERASSLGAGHARSAPGFVHVVRGERTSQSAR